MAIAKGKTRITVTLPDDLLQLIDEDAAKVNVSRSEYVFRLVRVRYRGDGRYVSSEPEVDNPFEN